MMKQAFTVITLLLKRECVLLRAAWKSIVGSALMYTVLLSLTAGYCMVPGGMNPALAIPLFLGSFVLVCNTVGYSMTLEIAHDVRSSGLMQYYFSLPVSTGVVMLGMLACWVFRLLLIAVPALLLGSTIIGRWELFHVSPVSAVLVLILAATFYSLMFLVLAFWCELKTLLGNIWPRFLSPLFNAGCIFFPWQIVHQKLGVYAYIMLLNPVVYCTEGVRSALLGGTYIDAWMCIGVLIAVNAALFVLWRRVVLQRLHAVVV